MKKVARAAFFVGLAGVACLLLGPLLARFGILPPIAGFALFSMHLPFGLAALVTGLLGVYVNWRDKGSAPTAVWAVVMGALLLLVVPLFLRPPQVPAIHDISTDLEDPPQFQALAQDEANQGRDLSFPHGGGEALAQHRDFYRDLSSHVSDLKPGDALVRAGVVATNLGWNVVRTATDAGLLEATATSGVFRFVDDIVVRVRPVYGATPVAEPAAEGVEVGAAPQAAPAEPPVVGSIIDLRSTSRVGQSDLGANAKRIREFLSKF